MNIFKKGLLGMLVVAGLLVSANTAEARSKVIQAKGSDTILNVSQSIAENYMKENRKARIAVTGGGSGVGISALINGTTDIAMASRSIKSNKYAIGYIGMGYMDNSVEAIKVDGIEASVENVASKKYPIAREVYWYVDNNASEDVSNLVDYALSSKGQELVKEEGFVPVK